MVTDLAACDLAAIYPKPTPRVIAKARPAIDSHAKKFIGMSPFCVLATSGADGSVDASPRGGNPGFVGVTGPNTLVMPDRSGNNRIDSFRNIVEGSGLLQLIFFVPGIDETLRVSGKGIVSTDPELMASMVEQVMRSFSTGSASPSRAWSRATSPAPGICSNSTMSTPRRGTGSATPTSIMPGAVRCP